MKKRPKGGNSRRLSMETLEDRTLLSANPVDFTAPDVYTYTTEGEEVRIDLEKADFFQFVDIDGDGTEDLIASYLQIGSGQFYFYKGNSANGTFSAPLEMGAPGSMYGSFNEVFTHNGTRYLVSLTRTLVTPLRVFQITTDGTGNPVLSQTASVTPDISGLLAYSGVGESMFDNPTITGIQLVDVTNDGNLDFVFSLSVYFQDYTGQVSSRTSQAIAYLPGTASGSFSSTAVELKSNNAAISGELIGIGDFAGLGGTNLQLITFDVNSGEFSVYSSDSAGSSSFTSQTQYTNSEVVNYISASYDIGKLSSSSKQMVALGVALNSSYGLMILEMDTSFNLTSSLTPLDIIPEYTSVGRITTNISSTPEDIFLSNGTQYQVLVWNTVQGKYIATDLISASANYYTSATGDFNGDGIQDLLAIGETQVTFFPGGDLTRPIIVLNLEPVSNFNYDSSARAIVADFNGDGIQDLAVISGQAGSTVYIYSWTVSTNTTGVKYPVFELKRSINISQPKMLLSGNFTENYANSSAKTKTDLLIVAGHTSKIAWVYKFNADWIDSGTPSSSSLGTTDQVSIAIADISGSGNLTTSPDGLDDIVLANYDAATVSIYRNTGGAFSSAAASVQVGRTNISHTCAVAVADFDGDGLLDIVALNKDTRLNDADGTGEIVVLRQTTQGTFHASITTYGVGGSPSRLAVGNLDGDAAGFPDILVGPNGYASTSGDMKDYTFTVFANNSAPTGGISFTTGQDYLLNAGTFSDIELLNIGLTLGRVDSNSSLDIVITCGNQVRVLRNNNADSSEIATTMLIYRELSVSSVSGDVADPTALSDQLTWVDEWASFYVEVWAMTEGNDAILSFENCVINYDPNLFRVDTSGFQKGNGFSTVSVDTSILGKIILSSSSGTGTASSSGNYTLLGRILLRPNTDTTSGKLGVAAPTTGYATSVSAGITFALGMTVTTNVSGAGGVISGNSSDLAVFPVIYDINDDGIVNLSDISALIRKYGKDTATDPSAQIFDYNLSEGKINLNDISLMIRSFGKSLAKSQTVTATSRYISYDAAMSAEWNTQSQSNLLSVLSSLEIENHEEFIIPTANIAPEELTLFTQSDPVPVADQIFTEQIEQTTNIADSVYETFSPPRERITTGLLAENRVVYDFSHSRRIGEYDTMFNDGFSLRGANGERLNTVGISVARDFALAVAIEETTDENGLDDDFLEKLIAAF